MGGGREDSGGCRSRHRYRDCVMCHSGTPKSSSYALFRLCKRLLPSTATTTSTTELSSCTEAQPLHHTSLTISEAVPDILTEGTLSESFEGSVDGCASYVQVELLKRVVAWLQRQYNDISSQSSWRRMREGVHHNTALSGSLSM